MIHKKRGVCYGIKGNNNAGGTNANYCGNCH